MKILLFKLFLSIGVVLFIGADVSASINSDFSTSKYSKDIRLVLDSIFSDTKVIDAFKAIASSPVFKDNDSTDRISDSSVNNRLFETAYNEALKNALKDGLGENSAEYNRAKDLIVTGRFKKEIKSSIDQIIAEFKSNLGDKVTTDDNLIQMAINKTLDRAEIAASSIPLPGKRHPLLQGFVDFFTSIKAEFNKSFFENSIKEDLVKIYQDRFISGLSKKLSQIRVEDLDNPSGRIALKNEIDRAIETFINSSARNSVSPIDDFIRNVISKKSFTYDIVLSIIENAGKDTKENIIQSEIFKAVAKAKLSEYGIKNNQEEYIKSLEIEKAPKLNSIIRKEAFTEITNNFVKNNLEAELQKQFMENKIDARGDFDIYFYKDNEGKTYVALEKSGGRGLIVFEANGKSLTYIQDNARFKSFIDKVYQNGNPSDFRVGTLINLRPVQDEKGNRGVASDPIIYDRDLDERNLDTDFRPVVGDL